MNNFKQTIFIILASGLLFSSCQKSMDYKFQDKQPSISCDGVNPELLKEALYSFENDISNLYTRQGDIVDLKWAYMEFIYVGAMGAAPYSRIASEHSNIVVNALSREKGLWLRTSDNKIKLNYNSPLMRCLVENISYAPIKKAMENLLDVNALEPNLLASILRINIREAMKDKYLATYIALDMYYRNLLELEILLETE
ncbi:MAG: hypothetical protein JKZ03_00685 [Flavobacteriaceae bacterium]|nr:hypothetical protein [Flavobacteriaceae bacterium]